VVACVAIDVNIVALLIDFQFPSQLSHRSHHVCRRRVKNGRLSFGDRRQFNVYEAKCDSLINSYRQQLGTTRAQTARVVERRASVGRQVPMREKRVSDLLHRDHGIGGVRKIVRRDLQPLKIEVSFNHRFDACFARLQDCVMDLLHERHRPPGDCQYVVPLGFDLEIDRHLVALV